MYRNQFYHPLLDKNLIRDALFQFTIGELESEPFEADANQALALSEHWSEENRKEEVKSDNATNSFIEQKLQ